jgi:SAM-dependent methyltransferase
MTPAEARAYWRAHEERFSDIDWDRDPNGLSGYVGPGQPEWLNTRHDRLQRQVFERLMSEVPPVAPGQRALDIGCGAGRWTRRLQQRGYTAVGIDLQERIIAMNRERFPEIEWHARALQDLPADRQFDLVTAVGVLEAIPYIEQAAVIGRIAAVIAPGGHALVLAALAHPSANAFPHPAEDWVRLFAEAGLSLSAQVPFGWEPLRRTAVAAVRTVAPSKALTPRLPTEATPIDPNRPSGAVWRAPRALRAVALVDDRLEVVFQRWRPRGLQPRWSAFLFGRA